MRATSVIGSALLMLCLTCHVLAMPSSGGMEAESTSRVGVGERIPQEFSFSLTRLPEDPKRYSLVISDADEKSISGVFTIDQLQILRAIMVEAEKFAFSGEAVGTKDRITTRFEDQHERSFIVDVEKAGDQSALFITIKSEIGRMTAEAGKVMRSSKREQGFFFDLLTRLESVLPKPGK